VHPSDPELFRRQLDEQLRREVELLYQAYLTKVRAWETVVRAQGEIAAAWPPLTLSGLLGAPPFAFPLLPAIELPAAPAEPPPAPALPATPTAPSAPAPVAMSDRKRPKAEAFEVRDAIVDALDQLGEVFDKNDLFRVLGFQPKRSNLYDALHRLVADKVLKVEWYGLGNKPTRYRQVRPA
jgi:hypothetical protein